MKKLAGIVLVLAAAVGLFMFLKSSMGTATIWSLSAGGTLFLPLVFFAALLDSINPCAFSVLLITIAFLLSLGLTREKIIRIGAAYVAGIFLTYVLIGLGILEALHLFSVPHFMGRLGAALLIVLGVINLLNEFFPNFPIKLKIPDGAHAKMGTLIHRASFPTAILLGALVALCEFPCTGGPYLMILGMLHDGATYLSGFGYLIFYNTVFILPLVLILFLASRRDLLAKVDAWRKSESKGIRLSVGVAMVLVGVVLLLV